MKNQDLLLNRKKSLQLAILLITCLYICNNSYAQNYTTVEGDSINPRFYLTAGYFFPNINTGLRVDSKIGIGTEINLEDDLKLEEDIKVFRIDGLIRISPRSQIYIGYISMKRNKTLTLEEDINFEDTTYYVGANARIKFNVDYFALSWRYSFFNEKNWNAGLSLGARGVNLNTSLTANLNTDSYENSANITAPALLLGVHGGAYLTPKLLARYSLEYLYLDISGIDITILESNASVSYFILKNIGIGVGYSSNNYRLRDFPLSDDFKGKVNFGFDGFNLFLSSRF